MYIAVLLTVITLPINYYTLRGWHISEVAVNFIMSVLPSARNISPPMERIFIKFYISIFFFRKSVKKIHFSFKPDKSNRYFT